MHGAGTPKQAGITAIFFVTLSIAATVGADAPIKLGDPIARLAPTELDRFVAGLEDFEEVEAPEDGLGPVFNNKSCIACHSSPAAGGDSNILETRFGSMDGTQFNPMSHAGGSLIQTDGLDARNGCPGETVPVGATIVAKRKSTPLFGLGLIDHVPDATLLALASAQQQATPNVAGTASIVTDAATGGQRVGRFGWKAQVATVLSFAADAYLNEMGITNPIFPAENAPGGDAAMLDRCDKVPGLEDDGTGVAALTDFMSMLAPPPRGPITPLVARGETVFKAVGCAICHEPTMTTGPSAIAALSEVTFAPFSDFLLHDMGKLGDGISQGAAGGQQMRTAPLWGLQARTRFLHDARSSTLESAIHEHDGQGSAARDAFEALSKSDARDLIAFLRSL